MVAVVWPQWTAHMVAAPDSIMTWTTRQLPTHNECAGTTTSRSARRRGRKRCGGFPTPHAETQLQAGLSGGMSQRAATLPSQSAAEVLNLLGGPFSPGAPLPEAAACWAPPMAFPAGGPLLQEGPSDAAPPPFAGWSLAEVGECEERCGFVIASLDTKDKIQRSQIVGWISKAAMSLALTKHGCRVVQKALEAASAADRDALVGVLEPFVEDLYDSPHGNHVLTKIVEVMPSAGIGFVIAKLVGKAAAVARHRFACRVLERLIEHCDESQIAPLIDEIVAESASLCKHSFGNFVVQHLIEHSPAHHAPILERMLKDLPALAMHRVASHVVQKIMDCSDEDGKQTIAAALLEAESPCTLAEVSCNRYGSFVVEQLARMNISGTEVKESIAASAEMLSQSPFGFRVLETCGLAAGACPPEASSSSE